MKKEKILEVVSAYKERMKNENIPKTRMEVGDFFKSKNQILCHAHYLLDGIEKYCSDPTKVGKTGRHLGSVQTLLWVAEWYTLDELMNHNGPDEK